MSAKNSFHNKNIFHQKKGFKKTSFTKKASSEKPSFTKKNFVSPTKLSCGKTIQNFNFDKIV